MFGIAGAPAIWQRFTEQLLANIPDVTGGGIKDFLFGRKFTLVIGNKPIAQICSPHFFYF